MDFDGLFELFRRALEQRLFTGAALVVMSGESMVLQNQWGTLAGAGTPEITRASLFDLASLTKVVATTPCWVVLASEKRGILEEPICTWFKDCPEDKAHITPRMLLAHSSGLPAWRPYYLRTPACASRSDFTGSNILAESLAYAPGNGTLYSDLGFMLLGFILERETGIELESYFRNRISQPLGLSEDLLFHPGERERERTAHTRPGEPPGMVNDLNARALGGAAGHAGLFGSADAVAGVADRILSSLISDSGLFDRRVLQAFSRRAGFVSSSTRALGFDTPSEEGSASGSFFSRNSLGHTGFTGTSVWMDPTKPVIAVLLTNRVFMGESDFRIKEFRPAVHDAFMKALR